MWQEAMDLGLDVYRLTRDFPRHETFGLTSQMRAAAVSVSSNIAEGAGRGGRGDMARFLRIALGSLAELESQIEIAIRIGCLDGDTPLATSIAPLRGRIKGLHNTMLGIRD